MSIRKTIAAALAVATLAGTAVATTGTAEARPGNGYGHQHYGRAYHAGPRYGHYRRGGRGFGVGAGLVGGLALGALAAGTYGAYAAPYGVYAAPCHVEGRQVVDSWGRPYIQNVRVCY